MATSRLHAYSPRRLVMKTQLQIWRIGRILVVLGCLLSATPRCSPATLAAQTAADSAAVRALVAGFEDAWHRHDMDAFAVLFHEDAAWVHWRGGYWRSRDGKRKRRS